MVDVVPIFATLVASSLHQNNIGVTHVGTSNFIIELVRFMPLYCVIMPQSIIRVIEASFVSTPIHIVDGVRSRPQTPRGTRFVSLHENIPKKVNIVFASKPLHPGGGRLDPPRPPRPLGNFGFPIVNPGMPPLPPNRPYRQPHNYPKYVKILT